MTEDTIRASFSDQSAACRALGSPFTADLCAAVATRLDRSSRIGAEILDWPGDPSPFADALALRLAGSLHALARSGASPELTALYPPQPTPDPDRLWAAVERAFRDHPDVLSEMLKVAPQTNEVGRSAPLMAGLLVIAHRTQMPLSLFELGASAGLNLNLDRFSYRLGELAVGDTGSPVRLAPDWQGPSPPDAKVQIVSRRGVDVAPLSAANPTHRDRLTAYVWPDQIERLARIEGALRITQAHPVTIDQDDAARWLEALLSEPGPAGVARVVFHTVAFQYFPPDSQARIVSKIDRVGRSSTKDTPLAWLRYEQDVQARTTVLKLTMWPSGEENRLATGHPHGTALTFFPWA